MEQLIAKNQTTAIAVGKACGVMQFAAAQRNLAVVEYTPMEVKQAVVGYGGAEKKQVQYMIQRILNLKELPKPDDAADALALAVCHAHSEKLRGLGADPGQASAPGSVATGQYRLRIRTPPSHRFA